MNGSLEHPERGSQNLTFSILFLVSGLSVLAFKQLEIFAHMESIASTFHTSWAPMEVVIVWRFSCFLAGAYAVFHMFRNGPGFMIVVFHKEQKEFPHHPSGIEKFVTFSSWTLLLNIVYFLSAGILSVLVINEVATPVWLNIMQVIFFSAGLGASFLTATVVRYVILPKEVELRRNHDHMFNFPNQMMHNFAVVFLAIEVLLVQPQLFPSFAFIGIILGALYAVFAYCFAFFGGGYYSYSFLDPRVRYAPLWLSGLAGAIALFYLGIWLVIHLLSLNTLIGSVVLATWVILILQFRSALEETATKT